MIHLQDPVLSLLLRMIAGTHCLRSGFLEAEIGVLKQVTHWGISLNKKKIIIFLKKGGKKSRAGKES